MFEIIIFFILQFVNVVLSTLRSILMVKATKHVSAFMNAFSYTFYSGIVKMMTGQTMGVVLIVTFLTNIFGVYFASWILEKFHKDKLWKIEVTFSKNYIDETIFKSWKTFTNLPFNYIDIGNYYIVNFYCMTQNDTLNARRLIETYKGKYFISESKNF